ncbi:hypothetical protein B0J17DRAFT_653132 [Rhizoctonia solani]|nr:hypothetical protein B0J17DRAFT_653132 [Rhizoctonia solani]
MASTANNSRTAGIWCAEDDNTSAASATLLAPLFQSYTIGETHNQRLPIHRLPTEVLAMIFRIVTCVETCIHDPYVTVSRTITLSAVCSYWRMVIINNSTFWTYIPIRNTPKPHSITSLCLERSRDSLIDAAAYLTGVDPWHAEKTLPLHVHRIRTLYISSRKIENVHSVMECILSSGVPRSLKHLSIKLTPPYHLGIAPSSILPQSLPELCESLYGLVKQLHTLHLRDVSLAPGSYSFDRLQNLLLDRACPADVVRVLTSSSDAQSIEVRNLIPGNDLGFPIDRPVVVGSLKRLCLGGILDSTTLCKLLEPLPSGPYEMELAMNATSGSWPDTPLGVDMLGSLLHKFNITRLTLDQALCVKVHTVLQNLPNLHDLNLVRFCLTQPMLAAMTRTYEQESNRAFPTLRKLRLRNTRIVDYEAFKAMVFSHHIDRIRISHCRLKWNGDTLTTQPSPSSPLYEWLSVVVPKVSLA